MICYFFLKGATGNIHFILYLYVRLLHLRVFSGWEASCVRTEVWFRNIVSIFLLLVGLQHRCATTDSLLEFFWQQQQQQQPASNCLFFFCLLAHRRSFVVVRSCAAWLWLCAPNASPRSRHQLWLQWHHVCGHHSPLFVFISFAFWQCAGRYLFKMKTLT